MGERGSKRVRSDPDQAIQLESISPRAMFSELMAGALGALGTRPSPHAVSYLIDLLELQLRTRDESLGLGLGLGPDGSSAPTLAEALLTALSEGGPRRLSRLRELGDRALFVSGFFGESLHCSAVGLGYYRDIGCAAYSRVSVGLVGSADDRRQRDLFQELADEFGAFVELLAEVGGRTRPEAPVDLLRLYDRYVETGSERDRAQLLRRGLVPPAADGMRRRQ